MFIFKNLKIQIRELCDRREKFLASLATFVDLSDKVQTTLHDYETFNGRSDTTETEQKEMVSYEFITK